MSLSPRLRRFRAVGEGLVREPAALVVGVLVVLLAIHEQPECSDDLLALSLILVVFSGEAAVDVRQNLSAAVLVALQRVEIDGVGEVGGRTVSLSSCNRLRVAASSASSVLLRRRSTMPTP